MNQQKLTRAKFRFYEYILYWLVTPILLLLAIPILVVKFFSYLIRSTGAPLKSVKNLFGFLLVILIVITGFLAYKIFIPYSIGSKIISVTVNESDHFSDVIRDLKTEGIVKDVRLFWYLSVYTETDKNISPGRYDFSGMVSLHSILDKFRQRSIATFLLTIPEGLTFWKTASVILKQTGLDSAKFVKLALDTVRSREKYKVDMLEGYLFPETYRLWYGIKEDEMIDVLMNEFRRQTEEIFNSAMPNNLSAREIVIMASIIESETSVLDEMGLVSAVYHNRIRKGMLLQADPTVIYAKGGLDRPLYHRDLAFDSPYNTYKYRGLPPGPINSPGLAAIKAAINPDNCDYLYFVADGSGRHIFSKTLREHNNARKKIKKLRLSSNKN